ncbi:MAG: hypothetical protein HC803_10805, partial [Saprospiraceae bacterium]|nr:hypothetical protein [Saprospiraceae bacterium]
MPIQGSDQTGVCQNSLVQLGTTALLNHTYSWTPTSGLNDPIGTPNANSAQPYLIAPNAPSGITYSLLVTEMTTGCQATDDVTISTNTDAPPTPTNKTYSYCGGASFTIGNNVIGSGLTFSWSVGAG